MVRLKGPLHSDQASGTFARTLTFAKNKSRKYARLRVTPHDPKSAGQLTCRSNLSQIGTAWKALSPSDAATWTAPANALMLPPYSFFSQINLRRLTEGKTIATAYPPVDTVPGPIGIYFSPTTPNTAAWLTTWTDSGTITAADEVITADPIAGLLTITLDYDDTVATTSLTLTGCTNLTNLIAPYSRFGSAPDVSGLAALVMLSLPGSLIGALPILSGNTALGYIEIDNAIDITAGMLDDFLIALAAGTAAFGGYLSAMGPAMPAPTGASEAARTTLSNLGWNLNFQP